MNRQFEITWSYNCVKGTVTHFRLYIKLGDQWKLLKEMNSYCNGSKSGSQSFTEVIEHDAPVGKEFVLGLTAVNQAGESKKIEYPIYIPVPDPDLPENFAITVKGVVK